MTAAQENIHPQSLTSMDVLAENPTDYLKNLRENVEKKAFDAIDWYIRHKKVKSFFSKLLRISAILLTLAGGLSPIFESINLLSVQFCQYGYLAFALAATCVGIDKFMGFSTSWMRYMMTAIRLQKSLADFQSDWNILWMDIEDNKPTKTQQKLLMQRTKAFHLKVVQEIEQETQLWTNEFQSSLSQLEYAATSQLDMTKQGIINLEIPNVDLAKNGVNIELNGVTVAHTLEKHIQIGHVPTGSHTLGIRGIIGETEQQSSQRVNMIADSVVDLNMHLPESKS